MDDYRGLFDLTGRTALVIGAGGIGAEVAMALAAHGAAVTAADLDGPTARSVADSCAGDWTTVDVNGASYLRS